MIFTMLIGPSGAGKTSWLMEHGAYSADSIVSTDRLRQIYCGDFQDQSQNPRVWNAAKTLIKTRLELGLSAVLDATNIKIGDRKRFLESVYPHKSLKTPLEVEYIIIDRPLEDKLERRDWRPEWLIRKHHATFNTENEGVNLKWALSADKLNKTTYGGSALSSLFRVTVKDLRKF